MKPDYGTASSEEIIAGIRVANDIVTSIRAVPNPAVQNMIRELISLMYIAEKEAADDPKS